jgi:hypothetical protein
MRGQDQIGFAANWSRFPRRTAIGAHIAAHIRLGLKFTA